MKNTLFATLIIISIIGCDATAVIDVDNSSGNEAAFLILFEGRSDTLKLVVPDAQKRSLPLGLSTNWTDEGIKRFLSEVNSVEILTDSDTLLMTDKKEIFTYFKERRRAGLMKKSVKIKVE